MIKFDSPKQIRFLGLLFTTAMLIMVSQCAFCQPASAQGLMYRMRARMEARMPFPPPPLVLPAPPFGYRPPVVVPNYYPMAPPQGPRVLVPPTPMQGQELGRYIAPPAGVIETPEMTFGIEIAQVGSGPSQGLEVRGFSPDSNLPQVGIRRGDVIISIDGRRTDSMAALLAARRQILGGNRATMQILRAGQLYQVQLPAWQADNSASMQADGIASANRAREDSASQSAAKPPIESSPIENSAIQSPRYQAVPGDVAQSQGLPSGPTLARPGASLGLKARDASPQRGVIVVAVPDGSAGKVAGIHLDDRIVSAAGRLIRDTSGLIRELALSTPGESITLGIVRGDTMRELVVEMGDRDGRPIQGPSNLAKSTPDPTTAPTKQSSEDDTSSSSSNLLNGVGAALGNFFGGSSSKQTASPKTSAESDAAAGTQPIDEDLVDGDTTEEDDNVFELPAPAPEKGSEPIDPFALPNDK